jgi:hypothetical protein
MLTMKVKVEGEITLKYGIDISHNCQVADIGYVGIKEDELNKEVAVLVMDKLKVYEKKNKNV